LKEYFKKTEGWSGSFFWSVKTYLLQEGMFFPVVSRGIRTSPNVISNMMRRYGSPAGTGGGLASIVNMEILAAEPPEKIESIWLEYHQSKPYISAVIPADIYTSMKERTQRAPMFVFPLLKPPGYLSVFFSSVEDTFLYTSLEEYRMMAGAAKPWLTIKHYTEFAQSKNIVLMRGETNEDELSLTDAKFLHNQTRLFLLDNTKYGLMRLFNAAPQHFNFKDVLTALDTLDTPDNPPPNISNSNNTNINNNQ